MAGYFKVLQSFYQAQSELEYSIKPIVSFCEEIKTIKKSTNYILLDSINTFSRITSQLLKINYSSKSYKKIKIEELGKAFTVILE